MSKIKNGGLDQYGAEPLEQQQFGTAGVEGVKPGFCTSIVIGCEMMYHTSTCNGWCYLHAAGSEIAAQSSVYCQLLAVFFVSAEPFLCHCRMSNVTFVSSCVCDTLCDITVHPVVIIVLKQVLQQECISRHMTPKTRSSLGYPGKIGEDLSEIRLNHRAKFHTNR